MVYIAVFEYKDMKNFNQTEIEKAKSEILLKVANMLMEIDNENLDRVDTTCDSIKNTIKSYNKRKVLTPGEVGEEVVY